MGTKALSSAATLFADMAVEGAGPGDWIDRAAPYVLAPDAAGVGLPVGVHGLFRVRGNLYYAIIDSEYRGSRSTCVAQSYCAALRQIGVDADGADADWLHGATRRKYQRSGRDGFGCAVYKAVAEIAARRGAAIEMGRVYRASGGPGAPSLRERSLIWRFVKRLADKGYGAGVIGVPGHLMAYRLSSSGALCVIDNGGWKRRSVGWRGGSVDGALGIRIKREGLDG